MSNMTIDERNYYRKHGICTVCGKEEAQEGGYLCAACRTKRRARYASLSSEKKREYNENATRHRKERREFRKKHGICVQCGQRPAAKDRYCCKECLLKAAEWKYRAKEKREKMEAE